MKTGQRRRLAAIMFTDTVGYSAIANRDEQRAINIVEEQHRLVIPIVVTSGGRVVKETGDGFLVVFASASEALECAVQIQTALRQRNSIAPLSQQILVRIGIHVGEIVEMSGDVFGDVVNIAARIEPLANAGGICVSEELVQQASRNTSREFYKVENPSLKNIKTPVGVYRVVMPWEPVPAALLRQEGGKQGTEIAIQWARKHRYFLLAAAGLVAVVVWRIVASSRETDVFAFVRDARGNTADVASKLGRMGSVVLATDFSDSGKSPIAAAKGDGLTADVVDGSFVIDRYAGGSDYWMTPIKSPPVGNFALHVKIHYLGGQLDTEPAFCIGFGGSEQRWNALSGHVSATGSGGIEFAPNGVANSLQHPDVWKPDEPFELTMVVLDGRLVVWKDGIQALDTEIKPATGTFSLGVGASCKVSYDDLVIVSLDNLGTVQ